ncbi:MAG: hypothetical protein ABJE10_03745 [bacterium]
MSLGSERRDPREFGDSDIEIVPRIVDRTSAEICYADSHGGFWQVTEHDTSVTPGARGSRCLIFDSSDMIRRVWDYPAQWRMLSVDALIALSWKR